MDRRTFLSTTMGIALLFPSSSLAQRALPHEPILSALASQQVNGDRDDLVPIEELEAALASGERIEVRCGTVSVLAQRALNRAGIRNRLVTTQTREAYNDDDNGHTMIEVRVNGRWWVYDVDNDRAFVNARGRGISTVKLCSSPIRQWRKIAHNPPADWLGTRDIDTWYDRVFGVPLIEFGDPYPNCLFAFRDKAERERLEAYAPNYRFVNKATWRALTGKRKRRS